MSEGFAEKSVLDLLPQSSGGGGGGTSDYSDLTNKPKINNTTLSGNKTSAQLGLVGDVQVNGTSVTTDGVANIPIASSSTVGVAKYDSGNGVGVTAAGYVYTVAASEQLINAKSNSYKPIVPANLDYAVRSVKPACTTLSGTTATITANTTYASTVNASGCTFTLVTPSSTDVYNGFILMLDTANSASIAFQTDGTPATSITISGNPTIQTGKKYTVTGQFSPLSNAWELFIISYEV